MKYAKQLTNTDCGAAVIANACKWAGMDFSFRKNHKFLMKKLNIPNDSGTNMATMTSFIRKTKVPFAIVDEIEYPTRSFLNKALKMGLAAIVFDIDFDDNPGHVYLITEDLKTHYLAVNYSSNRKVVSRIKKSYLNNRDLTTVFLIRKVKRRK